ncbi:MAG: CDP-diacylglycerol--glycerol-3-phosphate 3-phosphatidyltransferase [bacterium]
MSANTIRQDIVNIPNILTLFRIGLVPVVCFLIYDGTPQASFWAFVFFWIASVTDWLDGYIARKRNLVSLTGKFLDPLADKLLVTSALIMLVALGRVPASLVCIILAREVSITSLRALAGSEGLVIAAGEGGKLKTALQMVGLIGLLVHYTYEVDWLFVTLRVNFHIIGFWVLCISVLFSLGSAWEYLMGFVRAIEGRSRK